MEQLDSKAVGSIVSIVLEDNTLLEDVVCSISHPMPNKILLNLNSGQLSFEKTEE